LPGWLSFLRNHVDAIVAIDMLTVPTLGFGRLFAFIVIGHARRQLLHVEVTDHPTALWIARQITAAFPWSEAPTWLIRDNDGAYGMTFRRRLRRGHAIACPRPATSRPCLTRLGRPALWSD
jgi:hypothetical protein